MPLPRFAAIAVVALASQISFQTTAYAQAEQRPGLKPGLRQLNGLRQNDIDSMIMRPGYLDGGKGNSVLMAPGAISPGRLGLGSPADVPEQSFVVDNQGNETLSLSFWNAEGAWKSVQLAPASRSLIKCEACKEFVNVAMNDGKTDRYFRIPLKAKASIVWNVTASTWQLIGATEVPPPGTAASAPQIK